MDEIVIWGEVLLLIDFSMDFCALFFTYQLLGWKIVIWKLIIASALCAVLGLVCITLPLGTTSLCVVFIGWMISTILTMPSEKRCVRNILYVLVLFVLLEAFAGGIMTAIFCRLNQINKAAGIHFEHIESKQRIFLLASGIIFFILLAVNRILSNAKIRKEATQNGTVTVQWNGFEINTRCMFDSGNLVREPISGKHVMILPFKECSALGIEPNLLSSGKVFGSRLIPIKTLDKTSVLWGILPNTVKIRTSDAFYTGIELYVVFSSGTDIAIVPTGILEYAEVISRKEVKRC